MTIGKKVRKIKKLIFFEKRSQNLKFFVYISMRIKEMENKQRPREKALCQGIHTLSDAELAALIISSGVKQRPVEQIAHDLVKKSQGFSRLPDMSISELMEIEGIREAKALQIVAALELSKRAMRARSYAFSIHNPNDVTIWFEMEFGILQQEHFVCIYLNTKGKIITHKVLFKGSLNESLVHPREIFKEAFLQNAHSILLVHNHPSNDVTPSSADLTTTKRLVKIANTMGIQITDHIIVGRNQHYSFKEHHMLD